MDRKLNPYFGGIIGRIANRISNAEFQLNNKTYKLDKNDGENCLHGGRESFIWVSLFVVDSNTQVRSKYSLIGKNK